MDIFKPVAIGYQIRKFFIITEFTINAFIHDKHEVVVRKYIEFTDLRDTDYHIL